MSFKPSIDEIASLAKRRGFIFNSSDIYGGYAGIYDYGPYGTELVKNLKAAWWYYMVQLCPNIIGLDSGIFMHPAIWKASGHVDGFSDPLAECKECHTRVRVDHVLEDLGVFADEKMSSEEINKLFKENLDKIKCPNCKKQNFTDVKKFNLLVKANLGNFSEDWNEDPAYLRGETCQGIYVNFLNVTQSSRIKIPFGIAQIGKAFRNEISPRQFIFRTREFEQMEMQYFTSPEDELGEYEKLREYRWSFFTKFLGFSEENIRWHQHENLVFYAKEAYDIEYNFPFGFKELEGVHARGDYDLTQHQKGSGKKIDYLDLNTNTRYVPHVIESSIGVGRLLLATLTEAYTKVKDGDDEKCVLKLHPSLAPVKIAVFPLLKNKPELVEKAKTLYDELSKTFMCEFDDNGNIGKRYCRQDEIGTPYCVTVDFQTLEDETVTLRNRDTTKQERIPINGIINAVNIEKWS